MINKKENILIEKKDKILSKLTIRNYNNELEEILESKNYDEKIKNTLLNIVYKIETSYSDYVNVKRKVVSKDELIDTYFNIIKNNCEEILIIKEIPDDVRSYYKNIRVSKDNSKIKTYLNEKAMLYSLLMMNTITAHLNNDKYFVQDAFNKFLKVGYANNAIEVLRDFNGWSWELSKKEVQNNYYGILFQNLIYMLDDRYILDVCLKNDNSQENKDVLDILKEKIENKYGAEFAERYMQLMIKIIVQLYIAQSSKEKEKLIVEYKNQKKLLDEIRKKRSNLQLITDEKKKMLAQIKKIDTVLASKVALKEEYNKINKKMLSLGKEKISVRKLIRQLKDKRENLLDKIELYNRIISPKEYIREVELHENIINFIKKLDVLNINQSIQDLRIEIKKNFIKLEKMYLEKYKENIENIENKKEMLEKVYEFRYYNLLPINIKESLYEYNEFDLLIRNIQEQYITKMLNEKWIISITSSKNKLKNVNNENIVNSINFEILDYIFNNNVIKLDNLYVEAIKNKKGNLQINYYDGEVFCISKEYENINFSIINIRLGKKVKIF